MSLLESEERLRLALEAGRMGTWDWEIPTGRLRWSEDLEGMVGLAPGSFGGTLEDFFEKVHPQDREILKAQVEAGLEQRHDHHAEFRIVLPDGSVRWLEGRGQLLLDDVGRPVRMVGVTLDVTERKRIEEALRLLAEANSVIAASLDPNAIFESVARLAVPGLAAACLVDVIERGTMRRAAAVHADPACADVELSAPPNPEDESHPVVRAIRTGAVQEVPGSCFVVPLVARGKTRGAMTLLYSEAGRRYRSWDVSLAEELARRVALAADNLYVYHDARHAARAREQVLAVVSHDLRNLLHPIAMNAAHLLHGLPPGAPERRAVERIERSVEQMERLIEDLLDVASIEAGKLILERERLDAASLIAEVVESHRLGAASKSLRLESAVEPGPLVFSGDRHRLLQVFANLVGNALKFTPAEGKVTVGASRSGPGEIRFFVADTGLGISETELPHLFDPFWRSPSHGARGSGLGLSISQRIVEAHGGRIGVESAPGQGSVFSFTLPTESGGEE